MSLDSQFEAKLFKVLGRAMDDPTFADSIVAGDNDALARAGFALSKSDAEAAREFVRDMLVAKKSVTDTGEVTFSRAVFASGGKPRDLAATHGDIHGDGHGDVSVGKAARLDVLRVPGFGGFRGRGGPGGPQ